MPLIHDGRAVRNQTDTENHMRIKGRNLDPARASQLKNYHQMPHDRFDNLERTASAERLERLADVRPSVVRRGRALVADPNYPGAAILRQISRLLVRHLKP